MWWGRAHGSHPDHRRAGRCRTEFHHWGGSRAGAHDRRSRTGIDDGGTGAGIDDGGTGAGFDHHPGCGPIPAAAPGFCYDLAVISGEIVLEVESVVNADGVLDARSHHGLLLATRNLLAWTSNRVPPAMSSDLRLLTGVYADLGVQLDRLDPETVTMPRLQALVFTYVFDSAEVDGAELDLSARRLSAFVATSCGHGYPLMESLADLFADVRED